MDKKENIKMSYEEWLKLFYGRVDQNFSTTRQSLHTTHQWAITLNIALITAIFSLSSTSNPFPNRTGLIILMISLPILMRFFIRSCLEYSIQEKFKTVRNELDYYFTHKNIGNIKVLNSELYECIDSYYFKWLSPMKLISICWRNLLLAYMWIFIVNLGLLIWAICTVVGDIPLYTIGSLSVLMILFEFVTLIRYEGFSYKKWRSHKHIDEEISIIK